MFQALFSRGTAALLLLFLLTTTLAGAASDAKKKARPAQVTVVGTVDCLACALHGEGANSQCSLYGHDHSLRVSQITTNGKTRKAPVGTWFHFLPNDRSKELRAEKAHGKSFRVSGSLYSGANVLDVKTFKPL